MLSPKFLELARKRCRESKDRFLVGAVLIKGGKVIASGHNQVDRDLTGRPVRSIHAEEYILKRAGNLAKGAKLMVIRMRRSDGVLAISKPCLWRCMPLIQEAGIERIVYVDINGVICEERVYC